MRSANGVTDNVGNIRPFMNGSLKISEKGYRKVSVWEKDIEHYKSGILVDLLSDKMFDMLTRHIIELGYHLRSNIKFAQKEGVRSIIINGKEFRANSLVISGKKFGDNL